MFIANLIAYYKTLDRLSPAARETHKMIAELLEMSAMRLTDEINGEGEE